jgi:hypothetical protein
MNLKNTGAQTANATQWLLCLSFVPFTSACGASDSSLIREAKEAEKEERIIDNELMHENYPKSFRKGNPQYLERDFEAGVDFMCDEFRVQYGRDICAEPEINWRK